MKKPARLKKVDPDIEAFIRALAREAARQDHDEKLKGKLEPPAEAEPPAAKSRIKVVLRVPDGQGGYTTRPARTHEHDEEMRLITEHYLEAAEEWKAGRHDQYGISKLLKMRFPKKSQKV